MKKEMLEFLHKAQLPLYNEDKELIEEFIETFFSQYQPERSKREDIKDIRNNPFLRDSREAYINNDAVL